MPALLSPTPGTPPLQRFCRSTPQGLLHTVGAVHFGVRSAVPPLKLTTVPAALSLLAGANAAVLTLAAPAVAVPANCDPILGSVREVAITGGVTKNVGVKEGTWADVKSCLDDTRPSSPSPWWGSNSLAKDYAKAYGAVVEGESGGRPWLYPNLDPDSPTSGPKQVGPLAAWQVNGSGKVQAWAVREVGNGNGRGGSGLNGNEFVVDPGQSYFWLIDPFGEADPVPAPLPLLGGMMALLWSRRLRHRIARGQRAAG